VSSPSDPRSRGSRTTGPARRRPPLSAVVRGPELAAFTFIVGAPMPGMFITTWLIGCSRLSSSRSPATNGATRRRHRGRGSRVGSDGVDEVVMNEACTKNGSSAFRLR